MKAEKIIIGADHGGFSLKESLKPFLAEMGFAVVDVGTDSDQAVDYPDFGHIARHSAAPEQCNFDSSRRREYPIGS